MKAPPLYIIPFLYYSRAFKSVGVVWGYGIGADIAFPLTSIEGNHLMRIGGDRLLYSDSNYQTLAPAWG